MYIARRTLQQMEDPTAYERRIRGNVESASKRLGWTQEQRLVVDDAANKAIRYHLQQFQDLQNQASVSEREYNTWKNVADEL